MIHMKIALIPGDGIGKEVIAEGKKVIDTVSEKLNFEIYFTMCLTFIYSSTVKLFSNI